MHQHTLGCVCHEFWQKNQRKQVDVYHEENVKEETVGTAKRTWDMAMSKPAASEVANHCNERTIREEVSHFSNERYNCRVVVGSILHKTTGSPCLQLVVMGSLVIGLVWWVELVVVSWLLCRSAVLMRTTKQPTNNPCCLLRTLLTYLVDYNYSSVFCREKRRHLEDPKTQRRHGVEQPVEERLSDRSELFVSFFLLVACWTLWPCAGACALRRFAFAMANNNNKAWCNVIEYNCTIIIRRYYVGHRVVLNFTTCRSL